MPNFSRFLTMALALSPMIAAADSKWQFAGENKGISFHLQIRNQCKEGSKVTVKLNSALDHPVIVSFRLNDSDWRKSMSYKVEANGKDATVTYEPEESAVCHPYIDQVYLEREEPMVSQTVEDTATELP